MICAGGGGAPVTRGADGRLDGVEAVVDKDHVATLLAEQVDADRLLVLTDVPAVMTGFGTPEAAEVRRLTVAQARAGSWASGSMGPKVEACATFAATTGRPAAIGALEDVDAILAGRAGTTVG